MVKAKAKESFCPQCGGLKDGEYCPTCEETKLVEKAKRVLRRVEIRETYTTRLHKAAYKMRAEQRLADLHFWFKLWEDEKLGELFLDEKQSLDAKPDGYGKDSPVVLWKWQCFVYPKGKKSRNDLLFKIETNGKGGREEAPLKIIVYEESAAELAREAVESLYSHHSKKAFRQPELIHDWREISNAEVIP